MLVAAALVLAAVGLTAPPFAIAQEDMHKEAEVLAETPAEPLGVAVEAGFSSIYNFRGSNLFKEGKQMDQNGLAYGVLAYANGPWSLAYWTGWQTNGSNLSENIDVGYGAEQDLLAAWTTSLTDTVLLKIQGALYFWPMADSAITKTDFAYFLEPSAFVTWSDVIDATIGVAWFVGMPDSLKDYRYVYVSAMFAKTLELSPKLALAPTACLARKTYTSDLETEDNINDVMLTVPLIYAISDGLVLKPSVSAGWTNLSDLDFGDEYMVYGGLALGWAK